MCKVINFQERLQENNVQGFSHRCKQMLMGDIAEEKFGSLLVTVLREGDDEEPDMANYFYIRAINDKGNLIAEEVDIYFDDLEDEIRKIVLGSEN